MSKISYTDKAKADLTMLMLDTTSDLYCGNCHKKLGIFHIMRSALFKKKGSIYYVFCKHCRYRNDRVKGELSKKLDKRWENV
jgi:C4-type Zn-finger protein